MRESVNERTSFRQIELEREEVSEREREKVRELLSPFSHIKRATGRARAEKEIVREREGGA